MLQRFTNLVLAAMLLMASAGLTTVSAQTGAPQDDKAAKEEKEPKETRASKDTKSPTAEQVAETVILIYGRREGLAQIRRNGIERGRTLRTGSEGRVEEITYERRFVRGETADKDKVRLDQKMPTLEYSLIYSDGRVQGVINGTPFTPRQEAVADFLSQSHHGIDALLRYKENGAVITYVGKDKQKNIDMWILDLVDREKQRTRYYISAQKARVLWLEYEETPAEATKPVKFKKTFHDYRYAQGTLVPYRTVLYADGKQVEETNVMTMTYGVKMEDSIFQTTETATAGVP